MSAFDIYLISTLDSILNMCIISLCFYPIIKDCTCNVHNTACSCGCTNKSGNAKTS